MPNNGLPGWETEAIRLSVFPVSETAAVEALHWEQAVGVPPETVNRQSQQPQMPRIIEEGPWNNCRLQADSQRGQIHWRAFSGTPNPDGPGSIGSLSGVARPFQAAMSQWFAAHCPAINRFAFGANLMIPADSLQEVCAYLDGMLPTVSVADAGARDFVYRINRRRQSRHHQGLGINRLATWSAVQGMGFEIVIVGGVPSARVSEGRNFCRLELDINTIPIPTDVIPREVLPNVFAELIDAAIEISIEGDIP